MDLHKATVYHDKAFHKHMDEMQTAGLVKSDWRDWPFKMIRQWAKRYNHMRTYGWVNKETTDAK